MNTRDMNTKQKIGYGCLGCGGLLVVAFVGILIIGIIVGPQDKSDDTTPTPTPTPTRTTASPTPTPKPTPTKSATPTPQPSNPTETTETTEPELARTTAPKPKPTPTRTVTEEVAPPVYYDNCAEARAAGAAPVRRGQPGYGTHLDRDGDGTGCDS